MGSGGRQERKLVCIGGPRPELGWENRLQRKVQPSRRVVDGRGVGTHRVKGRDPGNSETVGRGS